MVGAAVIELEQRELAVDPLQAMLKAHTVTTEGFR